MKNQGFSLMEVCIAIALVGLMLGIGVPKMRRYIASGKDTKAISTLTTLRTASELYYSENGVPVFSVGGGDSFENAIEKLHDYVDAKTLNSIKTGKIDIGGSKSSADENATINYGGNVEITFINPNSKGESDGVNLWLKPEEGKEYDMKGNKWSEY